MAGRILLVDDDDSTCRLIQLMLGLEGHTVATAPTRDEALGAARLERPDLVMMDLMMPGLAPAEFIDTLRLEGFAGPVLLCSGYDGPIDIQATAVLKKPFDPDELIRLVGNLLP